MVKATVLSLLVVLILLPLTWQAEHDQFLKQCQSDADCSNGECCSKSFLSGNQGFCKPDLQDGDYCKVSTEPVCPKCAHGLYCKRIFWSSGRCTSSLKEE